MSIMDSFSQFWTAYPPRNGVKALKQQALTWWLSHKPDDGEVQAIMQGLARYKQTDQWKRGFVPDAIRFLRHRRWEDELSEPVNVPDEPIHERQARIRADDTARYVSEMREAERTRTRPVRGDF